MFCKKCGSQISDDAVFCTSCGYQIKKQAAPEVAPVTETVEPVVENAVEETVPVEPEKNTVQPDANQPVEQPEVQPVTPVYSNAVNNTDKKAGNVKPDGGNNTTRFVGIAAVGLVAVVALIIVCIIFSKPTINMNKYIDVTFEGYEGVGKAKVVFDDEKFDKDCSKKLKVKKLDKKTKQSLGILGMDEDDIGMYIVNNCVDYSLDSNTGLSNGDKVTLEWNVDEDTLNDYLKVKIKTKDVTYTVKELEKVELFDPFEYLELEYSGTAPNGSVDLKKDKSSDMVKYINFSSDTYSGLKNGDTITVTASLNTSDNEFANKFGCLPSSTEKQYTVEGIPAYIQSSGEITEDALEKMKKQTEDIIIASSADWNDDNHLESMEYVGNYFIWPKNDNWGANNKIYIVYKVTDKITRKDKNDAETSQDVSFYYCVAFSNLMTIPKDNSVYVDVTSYNKVTKSFSKKLDFIDVDRTRSYTYYFNGFETIDEVYKEAVIRNIENFNYEENITK